MPTQMQQQLPRLPAAVWQTSPLYLGIRSTQQLGAQRRVQAGESKLRVCLWCVCARGILSHRRVQTGEAMGKEMCH